MSRPRLFDPGERRDLHVYLTPQQLNYILTKAHKQRQSPSKIIRNYIDMMQVLEKIALEEKIDV